MPRVSYRKGELEVSRASKKQLKEGIASNITYRPIGPIESKGVCPRLRLTSQDALTTMRKGSGERLELEQAATVSVSACVRASNSYCLESNPWILAFIVDFRELLLLRPLLLAPGPT